MACRQEQYSAGHLHAISSANGVIVCAGTDRNVEAVDPRTWHVCGAWRAALKYDITMTALSPVTPMHTCAASGSDSEVAQHAGGEGALAEDLVGVARPL